ncbi:MAG TPA: radical SAM protein [Planctomycetota bacterium]|nr:radical SAM protein [Planctomycetota bacterium]
MNLQVTEIFTSIQGESTHAGRPCTFVRLTGCNLRCRWCDTTYALEGGESMPVESVVARVRATGCDLVEITGGEPLLQDAVYPLMDALVDEDLTLLVETNGSVDLARVPDDVIRIMDVKCPSSGMSDRTRGGNLDLLGRRDEVKFVLADRVDYEWARERLADDRRFEHVHAVHFTPVFGQLAASDLADWIVADKLPVRLGLQLHKVIWGAETRR